MPADWRTRVASSPLRTKVSRPIPALPLRKKTSRRPSAGSHRPRTAGGAPSEAHLWLGRAYGYQAQRSNLLRKPLLARKVHAHLEQAVACDPDHVAARWDLMEYYAKAPGFLGGSRRKAGEQAAAIARLDPAEGRKARQFLAEMDG